MQGIEAQDWDKVQAVAIEVHDTNKRLNSIQRLLEDNQFSNIVVYQEFVFKGTEIYGIYATRQAAN